MQRGKGWKDSELVAKAGWGPGAHSALAGGLWPASRKGKRKLGVWVEGEHPTEPSTWNKEEADSSFLSPLVGLGQPQAHTPSSWCQNKHLATVVSRQDLPAWSQKQLVPWCPLLMCTWEMLSHRAQLTPAPPSHKQSLPCREQTAAHSSNSDLTSHKLRLHA
jgi:hypothetical protein